MDSLSFLQSLAEATHETTTYAPLDNDNNCPYCSYTFYQMINEPEEGISEVECFQCHSTFFEDNRKIHAYALLSPMLYRRSAQAKI